MDKKIFVIIRKDGKYYNHLERWFASRVSLASHHVVPGPLEAIIAKKKLLDCSVVEILEKEWTADMATLTTCAVIQLDSVKKKLDDIRYILPTVTRFNKNLGETLKKTSDKLKIINPVFKEFVGRKSDDTFEVNGKYEEFITEISDLEMWEYHAITVMIKQYKKVRDERKTIQTPEGVCE